MTRNRIRVLKYFMQGKRNGVTPVQLIRFFFGSSYKKKAKQQIQKMTHGSEDAAVYLQGFTEPLYCPARYPVNSLHQVIVETFYNDNWHYYEIPETRVNSHDIVVDCGSAEGLFGFMVAHRCKALYLIEPLPVFQRCLQKTFEHYSYVKIVPLALADHDMTAWMSENHIASSLSTAGKGIEVKVSTLDRLFYEKNVPVSYIKMDLEGYDVKALQGAEMLIRRNKPKIAVTTYHDKNHAKQITEFLLSLVPEYTIRLKGIYQESGCPVMLHAWVEPKTF
jgi:FkbM family methyltransferase